MAGSNQPKPVRVRLAPSPTGALHVGTARTALFNELFARKQQGTFVVRIEDTDTARSRPEYETAILAGLTWLGLTWDEGPDIGGPYGPYRQSERQSFYAAAIEQLLASQQAYPEEGSSVIRLRVTPQAITFTDLIRGEVTVHSDSWGGDFIIARSAHEPLFHLAVVVDDAAQAITHVIRGEDHLTNTARHILLQRALGVREPHYAHLPLLLDSHRRKLSKRAGEVNLLAYRDAGYLPAAILNYLALLGWAPKDDREFFTHDELAAQFSLDDIQKGGAIFSLTKLQSVNRHYLRALTDTSLLAAATPWLEAAGITPADAPDYWQAALLTEQSRVSTLAELAAHMDMFRPGLDPAYEPELLIWRKSTPAGTYEALTAAAAQLAATPAERFEAKTLEADLLAWLASAGHDRGEVLWPLRVALTGAEHSPGPFEVAAVLGPVESRRRLATACVLFKKYLEYTNQHHS